jgi:hypothetical protein
MTFGTPMPRISEPRESPAVRRGRDLDTTHVSYSRPETAVEVDLQHFRRGNDSDGDFRRPHVVALDWRWNGNHCSTSGHGSLL